MSRRYLVVGLTALVVLAAAVVVFAMPSSHEPASAPPRATSRGYGGPQGVRSLTGGSFTASYPAGWSVSVARSGRARRYQLSSTGARIGNTGIGPAGTVAITVGELVLPGAEAPAAKGSSGEEAQLIGRLVGVPRAALGVTRTQAPRFTSLDGQPAVEESFSYTFAGHPNVQADVLVRRGAEVVVVELDGEPAFARAQEAAFEGLFRSWRWR